MKIVKEEIIIDMIQVNANEARPMPILAIGIDSNDFDEAYEMAKEEAQRVFQALAEKGDM